jgi:predicted transcriptional regulator YdeE
MKKKMIYVVATIVIAALAYGGWKMTSRSAYESADYSVVKSDGAIELRRYPDLMMATTSIRSRQGNDGSFGRLFQYISGSNDDKQKVAMTTPVFMSSDTSQESGTMGFVIPRKIAAGKVPKPLSEQVALATRPGGLFAVIRFAGRNDEELLEQQQRVLEEWIGKEGYEAEAEPELAGYDPPWTPGFLRRNEILIRVRSD